MKNTISNKIISNLIDTADRLNQNGRPAAALGMLANGLKQLPREKNLIYALTEILLDQERYQEALDTIDSLPLAGFDVRSAELKAECLERLQRFGESMIIVDQVIDIDPCSASAFNLKGLLLYHQHELDEAAVCFEKSVESLPPNGRAYHNLALLRLDQGLCECAIEMLKKGFKRSPQLKEVAVTFHEVMCEIGVFAEAEEMLCEALQEYPGNKRLAYLLIDILIRQKKIAEAMPVIERSLAIFGGDDGILEPALQIRNSLGPMIVNSDKQSNASISLCMIVKNEEKNLAENVWQV